MGRITTMVIGALAVASLSLVGAEAAAPLGPPSVLDDPTIVAIFDAANTADIETGTLAAQRAASNAELKALVVQVAPAFEAHMIAAQNLEKKLAGN